MEPTVEEQDQAQPPAAPQGAGIDLDVVRQLIHLMKQNGIAEIDWSMEKGRIRLKTAAAVAQAPLMLPAPAASPAPPAGPSAGGALPLSATEIEEVPAGQVISSPLVGVFFRAASPDRPPFVEVGDAITESSVLCIIEAMKVMNEIKAEVKGRVRKVLAQNGQSVEFGQPLFEIDPE